MREKISKLLTCIMLLNCCIFTDYVKAAEVTEPEMPEFRNHDTVKYEVTGEAEEILDFEGEYLTEAKSASGYSWNIEPVIFRTSEAVKPGEVFYLYGEGLTKKDMQIAIEAANGNAPSELPGENAYYVDPVQTDEDAQFAAIELPEEIEADTYFVWVKNQYGWSDGVKLNDARCEFLAENEMSLGITNRIYGKNLDQSEFGGKGQTTVVISNEEHSYKLPVYSVNPFSVEFGMPENVITGEYEVFVSNNDGKTYTKVSYYKSNKLTVYEKCEDPFDLRVGWAREFNYDLSLNVKDFGAVGDGVNDDLPAIQAAIDKASELGGGIVYIPNGIYRCVGNGTVKIRDYVVLAGESRDGTVLMDSYDGDDKSSTQFIASADAPNSIGRYGFYNFTIKNDERTANHPDCYLWIGNDWGARSAYRKIAKYMFVKDVNFVSEMIHHGKGRGMGIVMMADSHAIIDGINSFGHAMGINTAYVDFLQERNNDNYTVAGYMHGIGVCQTIENNYIYRYGKDYYHAGTLSNGESARNSYVNSQGIFARGPAYVAYNSINHTSMDYANDGEAICTECAGGGTKLYGSVVSSTENKMTINEIGGNGQQITQHNVAMMGGGTGNSGAATLYNWDYTRPMWGDYYCVTIVKGRGMGQYNYIKKADPVSKTFELVYDWKIKPDSTSKIVVNSISESFIMYKNDTQEALKGYWIYGDTMGCVAAENTGTEMEGVLIHAAMNQRVPNYRLNYYVRVDNNKFSKSAYCGERICGIGLIFDVAYSEFENVVLDYAIDIRGNGIYDANEKYPDRHITEAPDRSGIAITHKINNANVENFPILAKAIHIAGNTVKNSTHGLSLGGYSSNTDGVQAPLIGYVILDGNEFTDNEINMKYSDIPYMIMK
ncbi:MAG: glycosyl hydrolase family 28-related protein [Clostridia bacterium]|nr:glycosyl hydrolase family 28-related protein [Clostridia bacterium]